MQALQIFRNIGVFTGFPQIVDAALRGLGARTCEREDIYHRDGPLDALTMRDVGVCRESQDYCSSVDAPASAAQHLHRIADAARWRLPR